MRVSVLEDSKHIYTHYNEHVLFTKTLCAKRKKHALAKIRLLNKYTLSITLDNKIHQKSRYHNLHDRIRHSACVGYNVCLSIAGYILQQPMSDTMRIDTKLLLFVVVCDRLTNNNV